LGDDHVDASVDRFDRVARVDHHRHDERAAGVEPVHELGRWQSEAGAEDRHPFFDQHRDRVLDQVGHGARRAGRRRQPALAPELVQRGLHPIHEIAIELVGPAGR
jgi:hypothetical protein